MVNGLTISVSSADRLNLYRLHAKAFLNLTRNPNERRNPNATRNYEIKDTLDKSGTNFVPSVARLAEAHLVDQLLDRNSPGSQGAAVEYTALR